jgi:hypothetical protein
VTTGHKLISYQDGDGDGNHSHFKISTGLVMAFIALFGAAGWSVTIFRSLQADSVQLAIVRTVSEASRQIMADKHAEHEKMQSMWEASDRAIEERIADMQTQLTRIESKIDRHMERGSSR